VSLDSQDAAGVVDGARKQRRVIGALIIREMHTRFNGTRRTVLVPMVDLRPATPKYIFVRANNFYDETAGGRVFQQRDYYRPIPGVATNKLVQNPEF
jgi:hypothetical protein